MLGHNTVIGEVATRLCSPEGGHGMHSTGQKSARWTKTEFDLKYEIGDIGIFVKTFRGVVCSSHFLDFSEREVLESPSRVLEEHGVQAAQITSCQISKDLKKLSVRDGVIVYCVSTYNHRYVDTRQRFEEYQDKFKSKTRATLKKKVNKVLRDDQPKNVFRKFKTAQEIETFLKLAAVVSAKTYQHRLFNRGIPDNSEFCVHARKQAELGLVRGYLLYIDDKPVAYTYVPTVNEGILLYDYNGYDPGCSKLSPGTVLQFKIIEDLCSDPEVMIYDLCTGEDDAKTLFSTDSKYCADILVLRKSLKNIIIIMFHAAITSFSKALGRFLNRLNLKNRLKRYIRKNARTIESSQVEA